MVGHLLINLPIMVVVFLVGIPLLPGTRSANPARLDWAECVFCAVTLDMLVVPLVNALKLDGRGGAVSY